MRTPLSSLVGPPSRDLLEPIFGAGETGALDAGALLSRSMAKSMSLPSMTRRTSLSLDCLGGGDFAPLLELPGFEEPPGVREGCLPEGAGSLPSGTSALSPASRLKLNTSLPPKSLALLAPPSPRGSSGSLPNPRSRQFVDLLGTETPTAAVLEGADLFLASHLLEQIGSGSEDLRGLFQRVVLHHDGNPKRSKAKRGVFVSVRRLLPLHLLFDCKRSRLECKAEEGRGMWRNTGDCPSGAHCPESRGEEPPLGLSNIDSPVKLRRAAERADRHAPLLKLPISLRR